MNLYKLNQQLVSQLNPLTNEEINEKTHLFEKLLAATGNKHYMLLCNDYKYYTIFEEEKLIFNKRFSETVLEIITSLGNIYSIEKVEDDNAIELWIEPNDLPEEYKQPMVFYLFPYDMGVVRFA